MYQKLPCSRLILQHYTPSNQTRQILQYSARLIIGFYSNVLQKDTVQNLQSILANCSFGRRTFRLLKSASHVQLLLKKLNTLYKMDSYLSLQDRAYVLQCIEAFEQLCWVSELPSLLFLSVFISDVQPLSLKSLI